MHRLCSPMGDGCIGTGMKISMDVFVSLLVQSSALLNELVAFMPTFTTASKAPAATVAGPAVNEMTLRQIDELGRLPLPFGLQSRCRLGTFEPAKNLERGEVLALGNPCETAEPLQSRSRLGTFEPAESMEVSALGNPCETAQPQQNSGPMGGRLVRRADVVWAPLNPLKTWRVERYWRWATHAKRQSPSRIQAQWVAVWSAEPMSFGHLWTR